MEETAVNRLATSITRLTLSQVTTDEIDAATKLLDKACQKLRSIPDVPPQRTTDLETAIRQLSCILDSCTIAASAQVSFPTDDEYHPSKSRPAPRTLARSGN